MILYICESQDRKLLVSLADIQKEAWDPTCYSSHSPRLWHRPNRQNEQRRSPRRMYLYDNNSIEPMMADDYADTDITYP